MLSKTEIKMIDKMIQVYQNHYDRCGLFLPHKKAKKQQKEDMQRILLLEKVKRLCGGGEE